MCHEDTGLVYDILKILAVVKTPERKAAAYAIVTIVPLVICCCEKGQEDDKVPETGVRSLPVAAAVSRIQ